MHKLPDELADLTQLLRLDISHNLFLNLPTVVFKMPALRHLKANNNAIIGENTLSLLVSLKLDHANGVFFYFLSNFRNRGRSNQSDCLRFLGIR